jgi:hypothetical protein
MRTILLAAAILTPRTTFAAPPPAAYVRTDDSDEWVARSLHVPARPTRVLVVTEGPSPRRVSLPDLDLNLRRSPGDRSPGS